MNSQAGYGLFMSETNSVDAEFTSDYSYRRSGFSLDIQSTSCTDLVDMNSEEDEESSGMPNNCDDPAQEIMVSAGDILDWCHCH